jgi:hypothetical protein
MSGQRHSQAVFYPREKAPDTHWIGGWEAGWTSELVWTQRLEEKSFAFAGDQTPVNQSVVRRYTDWASKGRMSSEF